MVNACKGLGLVPLDLGAMFVHQTALGRVSGGPGNAPGFPNVDLRRTPPLNFCGQAADLVRVAPPPLRETVARCISCCKALWL